MPRDYSFQSWMARVERYLHFTTLHMQAREKASDRSKSRATDLVDWTMPPWSQDGLQTLQESCEQAADAEPAATTPAQVGACPGGVGVWQPG